MRSPPKGIFTDKEKEEVKVLYNDKNAAQTIAKMFHCRAETIVQILREQGIIIKQGQRVKNGWNQIYTREVIINTISTCKDLEDFHKNHAACYNAALRESDYEELTVNLLRKGGTHHRYIYRITDDVSVYYGLTNDLERRESHQRAGGKLAVQQIFKNGGRFEVISKLLSREEARILEISLISNPEISLVSGKLLVCVNKLSGGELGGSVRIWTKEAILVVALLCKHRSELRTLYNSAYVIARNRGWLEDVCSHMTFLRKYWTLEEVHSLALQCKFRSEFQDRFNPAYQSAQEYGWLDEVCLHMTRPLSKKKFWTLEKVISYAKQCKTKVEFRNRFPKARGAAQKYGWMKQINW